MKKSYTSDWNKISRQVRKESRNRCTNCKKKDKPKTYGRLEVHHIDGNKRNNARKNLVALCLKCHKTYQNYRLNQMAFITPEWVIRHRRYIKQRSS